MVQLQDQVLMGYYQSWLKLDTMSFNLGSWTCHYVSPQCLLLPAHRTKRPWSFQGEKEREEVNMNEILLKF